jgi:capsular polysaccharide transport system permease protein
VSEALHLPVDVAGLQPRPAEGRSPTEVLTEVDALLQRGADEEAIALLERAIERSPAARGLADRLVNHHVAVGRIANALEAGWSDVCRNGADPRRSSLIAHLAVQVGDFDRALFAARQAVAADPQGAANQSMLSSLAFRHGLFEEAERAARAAVALEPHRIAHRHLLTAILSRLDRAEDVIVTLVDAVATAPDDALLRLELSAAYAVAGRLLEAEREARLALALDPSSLDARLHLSGLCAPLGHADEAIELVREVVRRKPEHALAHYSLSHMLWVRGEADLAIVHAGSAAALEAQGPGSELGFRDHHLALLQLRAMQPAEEFRPTDSLLDGFGDPDSSAASRRAGPLAVRARIIFALMLREMHTRHANTRLGFAWAIVEPLAHLSVLAAIFAIFNRGRPPLGWDWFFFYATGVIPFLMWSHVTTNGFHGLVANTHILQIPAIRRLDVLAASALVELAIAVAVGSVMFYAFWAVGKGPAPRDPLAVIEAIVLLWLFAFGLSLVNATVETVNGSWLRIWPSIIRLQYFTSGVFYVPQEMPDWLRDILVLNPLLLCLEWFRTGFFDQYDPPWLDKQYAVVVTLLVILFGLMLEVALRRRALR